MLNKINIAAFDLDGTLLDSADDLINCLNLVLEEEKKNKIDKKFVYKLVGNGALAMIKEAFKINGLLLKKTEYERLIKRFLLYYKVKCVQSSKLYPFAIETLDKLQTEGFKLILVSNKPEYFVEKILKHFKIYKYFVSISGGDTFNFKKPDVRHLTETIRMANIKNYECWFIGDSESDALCAKRANSKLILLKHGYSKDNLYSLGADYVLNDLSEVYNVLVKKISFN